MVKLPKRIRAIQEIIQDNPYLGERKESGIYYYESNNYIVEYRILKIQAGTPKIEWLTIKRRLNSLEQFLRFVFFPLWKILYYTRVGYILRSHVAWFVIATGVSLLIILLPSIRINLIETGVSLIKGLPKKSVKYESSGWVRLSYPYFNQQTGYKQSVIHYISILNWTGFSSRERWQKEFITPSEIGVISSKSDLVWARLIWYKPISVSNGLENNVWARMSWE